MTLTIEEQDRQAFYDWRSKQENPAIYDTFLAGVAYGRKGVANVMPMFSPAVAGQSASITLEDIYSAYPLKVGKQAAIKAIKKALKDTHMKPQALLDATQAFAAAVAQWPEAEKKFIPHPATFFNAGRYDDDQSAWVKGKPIYQSQFGQSH